MRIATLLLAVVNLGLVGFLLWSSRPASIPVVPEREDRTAALLARLDRLIADEEKQATLTREMQKELTALKKESAGTLAALDAITEQVGSGSKDLSVRVEAIVKGVETLEKKFEKTDAKQLTELAAELRRLNEQFKRVVDFAAGRSGL